MNHRSAEASLRPYLQGELLLPGNAAYDAARRVASVNRGTDRHPRAIVRCRTGEDAALAIAFAREQGLDVAVKSGGHDVLGGSTGDGVVIDMSPIKHIRIDPRQRRAHVGAGVLAGELLAACHPHGLMPLVGVNPDVGMAGLTLGGGLGLFLGRHGATCDHLLGAGVVGADGRSLHAGPEENPDLLWALKGGGGNFGIVTELEYRLHPVGPLLGGLIAYRTDVAAFLRFYAEQMQNAPDELTAEIVIFGLGKPVVAAILCWCGDRAQGERVLAPWKTYGKPLINAVEAVDHAELNSRIGIEYLFRRLGFNPQAMFKSRPQKLSPGYNGWRAASMQNLSLEAAELFAEAAALAPETWTIGLSHYLHGQACRVTEQESPLPRPQGRFSYLFGCSWRNPDAEDKAMRWMEESMAAMAPHAAEGSYVNFLSTNDEAAVRQAYGASYARLAELKHRYDPDNLFRGNRNIRPAVKPASSPAAMLESAG